MLSRLVCTFMPLLIGLSLISAQPTFDLTQTSFEYLQASGRVSLPSFFDSSPMTSAHGLRDRRLTSGLRNGLPRNFVTLGS